MVTIVRLNYWQWMCKIKEVAINTYKHLIKNKDDIMNTLQA